MHYRILFALLSGLLFVTACTKEEQFACRIHFINGSIGAQPLSMQADSTVLFNGLQYDSLVTNVPVPSGTYQLSFRTGTASPLRFTTNLQAGEGYTGVLYDSAYKAKLFFRKDVYPAAPAANRCFVRLYNMIVGSSGLYLTNTAGQVLLRDRSFGDFESQGIAFTELDTISRPTLRVSGTDSIAVLPPFESGKIYTLFLTGKVTDLSGTYRRKVIIQTHN